MKYVVFASLLFFCSAASAECWVVKNMKGSVLAKRNFYENEKDAFSGVFKVTIAKGSSSVEYDGLNAGELSYIAITPKTVIGFFNEAGKTTTETWAMNDDGKAFMTKTTIGFGEFDASRAFVGDIVGKC